MICKYPPIQGGVSAECYWTAQCLAEMGNAVSVLTNAQEVEDDYRITMNPEDEKLLSGFWKSNTVRVVSTYSDKHHIFVPQTNPFVSKLLSLGMNMVQDEKPDLIWAHYIEPYGVVAFLLSRLTGIPYVIRHAGSDIGRLMPTAQLRAIHCKVLQNSIAVITHQLHHERFVQLGVPFHSLIRSTSVKTMPDLFFPTPFSIHSPIVLGVYGKTGESKGTDALFDALTLLRKEEVRIKVRAHWGGRNISQYLQKIRDFALDGDTLNVSGFIAHWRIPEFIRSCDAIFFLENRFSIGFHHSSVPLEVVSCGRPVITTAEMARKPFYENILKDGKNAFVIEGNITGEKVAAEVKRVKDVFGGQGDVHLSSPSFVSRVHLRIRLYKLLEDIRLRLSYHSFGKEQMI